VARVGGEINEEILLYEKPEGKLLLEMPGHSWWLI